MAPSDVVSALQGTSCDVKLPSAFDSIESLVPRWSLYGISKPHAIVTPSTAADVGAVIAYAAEHRLKIVPTGGGHGSFVPVDSNTIYLSLSNFRTVELDETEGLVSVGGGAVTGEVLNTLGEKGWYTLVPNSNKVGLVGALLGAMHHNLVGKHGLGSDCVEEITIIPFSAPDGSKPKEIAVRRNSTDASQRRLYNVLCGAGHGFGIITSLKIRAWPIKDLKMTDDKVWTRSMIFPPNALEAAARAFLSFSPPPPLMKPTMVILRARPNTPHPGSSMILLALSYFGPAEDAEGFCEKTIPKDAISKAVNVTTGAMDYSKMNDPYAAMSRHGGAKEFEGGFVKEVDIADIGRAFELWLRNTDADMSSRGSSSMIFSSYKSDEEQRIGKTLSPSMVAGRGRGLFVQATPWYARPDERGDAYAFARGAIEALKTRDTSNGEKSWGFVNNARIEQDMREIFSDEAITEIRTVKAIWDRHNIGWNPVVDGW